MLCELLGTNSRKTAEWVPEAAGILRATETLIKGDWLPSLTGLVAARVFGDYLDMAEELARRKMESAAVVIAMGSLEVHLRRMASAANLDAAGTKPADTVSVELKKVGALNAAEQKQITAFLEIRKQAASGKHDQVRDGSAEMIIPWVRLFIDTHPA
jgi:hypothetical protein